MNEVFTVQGMTCGHCEKAVTTAIKLLDPNAKPGESVFDHFVYVIAGDGDVQEGVSAESASIAGHLGLGNLIAIYDANQISIEDDTDISFTEDVAARYRAYGWQTLEVDWRRGGNYNEDVAALYEAIQSAKANTDQPTLITLRTIIGWPSPSKQNTGKILGSKKQEAKGLVTKEAAREKAKSADSM